MYKQDKVSLSRTLGAGSEEDFDVICDACNSDGQRVEATGHCIDCNVNMCVSCLKFHTKLPSVKSHIIKNKITLSQSQKKRQMVNKLAADKDPLTDRCTKHPDELTKFYCNTHNMLGCSVCVSLDHRSCTDMAYIKDICSGVAERDEMKKVLDELHMLVARLTSAQSRSEWIKEAIKESNFRAVSDIRNLKKEIIDMLNQLENDILEKTSLVYNERICELTSTISSYESMVGEVATMIADLEKKTSIGHESQLFISMKKSQVQMGAMTDKVNNQTSDNKCQNLSFQPDQLLTDLMANLVSLGKVSVVSTTSDVRAKFQYEIDVKSETDTDDCSINAIIELPDGRLLFSDYENTSVKLANMSQRKVSEQIQLESNPLDMALSSEDTIVVTLDKKRYIQVLSVSPTLALSHTINMPGFYRAVEYIPEKLFLICREPIPGVHVCDLSGILLQRIECDYGGKKLFTFPFRIAISPDHGTLYITDCEEDAVVSLTSDGDLIAKCTNEKLLEPYGITSDVDGYIYVCSFDTNVIQLLSSSGKLMKNLLEEKDGIIMPWSIACRADNLYFSSSSVTHPINRNMVNVYKLEK